MDYETFKNPHKNGFEEPLFTVNSGSCASTNHDVHVDASVRMPEGRRDDGKARDGMNSISMKDGVYLYITLSVITNCTITAGSFIHLNANGEGTQFFGTGGAVIDRDINKNESRTFEIKLKSFGKPLEELPPRLSLQIFKIDQNKVKVPYVCNGDQIQLHHYLFVHDLLQSITRGVIKILLIGTPGDGKSRIVTVLLNALRREKSDVAFSLDSEDHVTKEYQRYGYGDLIQFFDSYGITGKSYPSYSFEAMLKGALPFKHKVEQDVDELEVKEERKPDPVGLVLSQGNIHSPENLNRVKEYIRKIRHTNVVVLVTFAKQIEFDPEVQKKFSEALGIPMHRIVLMENSCQEDDFHSQFEMERNAVKALGLLIRSGEDTKTHF